MVSPGSDSGSENGRTDLRLCTQRRKNFHVLVITIERREATVIQASVAPQILAELLKNPDEMGKALTDEATISDP